jgi:uncharacterized circularly permuted ATP-grasp superfamily protein
MRLISIILVQLYLIVALNGGSYAFAQDEGPVYDELFDAVGNLRSQYVDIYAIHKRLSESEKNRLRQQFRKIDFRNDNTLHTFPRVMLESEIDLLRKGVDQRGQAIRLFLEDLYSGRRSFDAAGIFPEGVLERLMARYHEQNFVGKVDPKSMAFIYGPDIIRGPDGSFFVIEDNHGFVGGLGDLITAREALFRRIPEYREVLDIAHNPAQFYEELIEEFKALRKNNGPIVMVSPSLSQTAENEDVRLRSIMKNLGVELVSPYSGNKLVMEGDKAFLVKPLPNGRTSKVEIGFVYLHGEPVFFADAQKSELYRDRLTYDDGQRMAEYYELLKKDYSSLSREEREWVDHLKQFPPKQLQEQLDLLRAALAPGATGQVDYNRIDQLVKSNPHIQFTKGAFVGNIPSELIDAIARGKVPSSYAAGTEMISDKEFYLYVEKMIRHYLKQEPIIRNLPTESLGQKPEMIEEFAKNPKKYVVKKVDGRGGKEVYIGSKMNKQSIAKALAAMRAKPGDYIIQGKTSLSQFDGLIVDNRLLSFISRRGSVVSYIPWGRGQTIDGDGKVNLSQSGREVTIIPVRDPQFTECNRLGRSAHTRMPGRFRRQ